MCLNDHETVVVCSHFVLLLSITSMRWETTRRLKVFARKEQKSEEAVGIWVLSGRRQTVGGLTDLLRSCQEYVVFNCLWYWYFHRHICPSQMEKGRGGDSRLAESLTVGARAPPNAGENPLIGNPLSHCYGYCTKTSRRLTSERRKITYGHLLTSISSRVCLLMLHLVLLQKKKQKQKTVYQFMLQGISPWFDQMQNNLFAQSRTGPTTFTPVIFRGVVHYHSVRSLYIQTRVKEVERENGGPLNKTKNSTRKQSWSGMD